MKIISKNTFLITINSSKIILSTTEYLLNKNLTLTEEQGYQILNLTLTATPSVSLDMQSTATFFIR
ncbi:hypothetical protein EGC77_12800 [Shewanella psychromarinicola]|uniref:Uncharacterized protein n=1 Tax=Shewanella psychromarinicola TaxID=2487742 RepID=A0A3N4E0Z8_9GAMM|nr:hypothetical protein EGC77_12800 [Shewanella psychromarinicola]